METAVPYQISESFTDADDVEWTFEGSMCLPGEYCPQQTTDGFNRVCPSGYYCADFAVGAYTGKC